MTKLKLSKYFNNIDFKFDIIRISVSIIISLMIAMGIIFLVSKVPLDAIKYLFLGPLESKRRFMNVIELMIPLTFTGLSVTIMFKTKQFNMISEGVFYISGVIASVLAITLPMPSIIHPFFIIFVSGLIGGLIATIPSLIKLKWDSSELVSSLMLNFILFNLGLFVINNYFRDINAGSMASWKFLSTATLPNIFRGTRLHLGIFIAIFIYIASCFFINKTGYGYKLRVTGQNILFAKYSGMKTSLIILLSQFIGGFVASIGGATEILGMYDRFKWQELTGYGFDGIIVAILSKENPIFVPISAFFLAYLRIGADKMGGATDITFEIVSILQGIIIMLIAAKRFLSTYRQKMVEKEAKLHG